MSKEQSKPIRFGLIGVGAIGQRHAQILHECIDAHLVGICDENPAVEKYAGDLGVSWYTSYEKMVEELQLEAVIIATPAASHSEIGITCVRNGVHVFVEKPIADTLKAARQLVAAAREHGVQLLVGHHRRHNPSVQCLRETIAAGRLGRLVGVNVLWMLKKPDDYFDLPWRCRAGGGPFLINLIHEIDNLRYVCGEVERVYAESSSMVRNFPVEDTGSISLRFVNGVLGTLLISDCTPSYWSYEQSSGENPFYFQTEGNCYHFFGTEASLSFPDMKLVCFADKEKEGWQFPLADKKLAVVPVDPLVAQCNHFCKVVRGFEEPKVSGEDGLRTLEVVLGIIDSAQYGHAVTFGR
jgi:predicted dehydrogenase